MSKNVKILIGVLVIFVVVVVTVGAKRTDLFKGNLRLVPTTKTLTSAVDLNIKKNLAEGDEIAIASHPTENVKIASVTLKANAVSDLKLKQLTFYIELVNPNDNEAYMANTTELYNVKLCRHNSNCAKNRDVIAPVITNEYGGWGFTSSSGLQSIVRYDFSMSRNLIIHADRQIILDLHADVDAFCNWTYDYTKPEGSRDVHHPDPHVLRVSINGDEGVGVGGVRIQDDKDNTLYFPKSRVALQNTTVWGDPLPPDPRPGYDTGCRNR